nr:PadR family transcriptional regulator [Mesorhizobium sp.]
MDVPRLSPVEYKILDLLRGKEMYGLEMIHASPNLKRGTIYVTLDRMTDKGLVKSRVEERPTGRSGIARRIYSITGHGQRIFNAVLAAAAAYAGTPI